MTLKAKIFAAAGQPERGFSAAVRAASTAMRARILPALWDAVGALAGILNELEEYRAANELLAAIMPQALEAGEMALSAELYSFHADACMGLAGKEEDKSSKTMWLARTSTYLDRSLECKL